MPEIRPDYKRNSWCTDLTDDTLCGGFRLKNSPPRASRPDLLEGELAEQLARLEVQLNSVAAGRIRRELHAVVVELNANVVGVRRGPFGIPDELAGLRYEVQVGLVQRITHVVLQDHVTAL